LIRGRTRPGSSERSSWRASKWTARSCCSAISPRTTPKARRSTSEQLVSERDERILILPHGDDTALVNTLQTKAAVVLQKSIREGFGLTVTEAMWKGTPVIGGNVGGIRYQIRDGVNGFLVSSIEETAHRIVQLVRNRKLREQMGRKARESVAKNFLLSRYLEQYLDLFNAFEASFHLNKA